MLIGLLHWAGFILQSASAWVAIRKVALRIPFRIACSPAVCRGVAVHAAALAKEWAATRGAPAAKMRAVNVPVGSSGVESRVRGSGSSLLDVVE